MSDAHVVQCPAVLDLACAPELRDTLLRALSGGADVDVHAAAVTQADTACLQLLCAAAVALARQGRALKLVEPSAALIRVAERLGVATVLGAAGPSRPGAGPDIDTAR
jgi:anti-anti-sigma regulatory factor